MQYDLLNDTELMIFKEQVKWLIDNKKICKLDKVNKTRSITQNSALHKYFELISDKLNEMGFTFSYTGLKGFELNIKYTPRIVKTMIIKPIMVNMFNIESTTKLTTEMINDIIDVINGYFSSRGEYIPFPSIQSLIDYYQNK